jgi:hypothetical protein
MNQVPRKLAVVLMLAFVAGACRTAPVYSVDQQPLRLAPSATLEDSRKHIERAARLHGWQVEDLGGQKLLATKRRGQHAAAVEIGYDERSFSISYRDSVLLRYDGRRIHKAYNGWVQALEGGIAGADVAAGPD